MEERPSSDLKGVGATFRQRSPRFSNHYFLLDRPRSPPSPLPRSLPFTYQPTLVPSAQLLSSFTFPRNSRSKFSNGSLVTRRGRKRSRCSKCRALDTTWTPLNENLSEIFVEKRCVDVCMDKKKRFFFE